MRNRGTSRKLASKVQLLRIRVATAKVELRDIRQDARQAKRRHKEARQAARQARKLFKESKTELAELRKALAKAEAKLRRAGGMPLLKDTAMPTTAEESDSPRQEVDDAVPSLTPPVTESPDRSSDDYEEDV